LRIDSDKTIDYGEYSTKQQPSGSILFFGRQMSTNDRTTVDMGTGVDESLRTADIIETASQMPEISRFLEAVRASGLEHDLRTPDFKTLFAPRNEALGRDLPKDSAKLGEIVSRHIVIGRQTEADLRTTAKVRTLSGEEMPVEYRDDGALFGGARIVRRDVPCVNGHIQVIDRIASS
jgi:uncharacterized surface protein with fasciclin (FAS1) repeats